jgi:hypothetical protein
MSSSFANRFNLAARPLLWESHSEIVDLVVDGASSPLRGVWRRVQPEAPDADGLGMQSYAGDTTFVVKVADLPTDPGPTATIVREQETWAIRHIERQDEWTWILHLSRPDPEVRMPARLRG